MSSTRNNTHRFTAPFSIDRPPDTCFPCLSSAGRGEGKKDYFFGAKENNEIESSKSTTFYCPPSVEHRKVSLLSPPWCIRADWQKEEREGAKILRPKVTETGTQSHEGGEAAAAAAFIAALLDWPT